MFQTGGLCHCDGPGLVEAGLNVSGCLCPCRQVETIRLLFVVTLFLPGGLCHCDGAGLVESGLNVSACLCGAFCVLLDWLVTITCLLL